MSLKTAIAQLEATVITDAVLNGDASYVMLDDGREVGPLKESALSEDLLDGDVTYYWCDALRFSGTSEVQPEDALEDLL